MYAPADKRQHGYHVLPFLLGDRLVTHSTSRLTAKAAGSWHAVHFEPHAPSDVMDMPRNSPPWRTAPSRPGLSYHPRWPSSGPFVVKRSLRTAAVTSQLGGKHAYMGRV